MDAKGIALSLRRGRTSAKVKTQALSWQKQVSPARGLRSLLWDQNSIHWSALVQDTLISPRHLNTSGSLYLLEGKEEESSEEDREKSLPGEPGSTALSTHYSTPHLRCIWSLAHLRRIPALFLKVGLMASTHIWR